MAIFRQRPHNWVVGTGGVGTNHDSGRIAGCWSMTAAVRYQQLMVFRAVVYNSYGAHLFIAQIAMHQWIVCQREENTTEFLLYMVFISEAEVTNNRRLSSMYCTVEDRLLTDTKHRTVSLRQQGYFVTKNSVGCSVLFSYNTVIIISCHGVCNV